MRALDASHDASDNNKNKIMNTIKKIVLTGGPCAGKTTALVKIIDHFSGLGYKVFTIPEVPTMFTQAGMNYLTKTRSSSSREKKLPS